MKRLGRFLTILGLATAVIIAGLLTPTPPPADAANPSDFNPSLIISDGVMSNNGSMSAGDIQAFFNSKMPVCDTAGTKPYGGTTRAAYGTSRGVPPPYICLKDFNEGGISAAQIIWNKSQEFRINPQVLIVLLQKEQGLVTDDWPWPTQYRSATGYGCPDSTPGVCDSQYYGFTNQIHWAATLHRRILDQAPTWTNYYPPGVRQIQYNPNASCGGTNINIANLATSALYNYTPYQPNAAAMGNLYGTGDGCSAYGNRNFWRDFTDWFGNPLGMPFQWQWISQTPLVHMVTGEVTTFTLRARNTGTATWTNSGAQPVRLGTANPQDRSSNLCHSSWINCRRAATLNEASVAPGQEGTFSFTGRMPQPGYYHERFNLLAENNMWMNDVGQYFEIRVDPAITYAGQSAYPNIYAGASTTISFLYKNQAAQNPWYGDIGIGSAPSGTKPLHLATSRPINRNSIFAQSWPAPNRPAVNFAAVYQSDGTTLTPNQNVVYAGQIAKFSFNIRGPDDGNGTYREYFQPIMEGGFDLNDPGTFSDITVRQPIYTASYAGQSAYPSVVAGGAGSTSAYILYRNTGDQNWYDDTSVGSAPAGTKPVHLATSNPVNRASGLSDGWITTNRPRVNFSAVYESDGVTLASNQQVVQPGQIARFNFNFKAPSGMAPGVYREYFRPIVEGGSTMNDSGTFLDVTVQSPTYTSAYAGQSGYPTVTAGGTAAAAYFLYKNSGNLAWYDDTSVGSAPAGTKPVHLATSNPVNRASGLSDGWITTNRPRVNFSAVYESDGVTLASNQQVVQPGQIARFNFNFKAPSGMAPGVYREYFRPIVEGGSTMNDSGTFLDVTVQ